MMTSSGAGSAAGGGNVGAAPEHSLAGRGVGQSLPEPREVSVQGREKIK